MRDHAFPILVMVAAALLLRLLILMRYRKPKGDDS